MLKHVTDIITFNYLKFLKQNLKSSIKQEYPAVFYAELSQSGPAES